MLSCTDMRAAEAATAVEASLGKPVVTSNRTIMQAALKRIGVSHGECALRGQAASGLAMVANAVIGAPFDVWAGDPQTPLPPPHAVTIFRVGRVLKGLPVSGRIAVLHQTDPGACGLGFTTEEDYLLAFSLRKMDEPGPLRIGHCSVRTVDAAKSRGDE